MNPNNSSFCRSESASGASAEVEELGQESQAAAEATLGEQSRRGETTWLSPAAETKRKDFYWRTQER
jgi:hypothetical protein